MVDRVDAPRKRPAPSAPTDEEIAESQRPQKKRTYNIEEAPVTLDPTEDDMMSEDEQPEERSLGAARKEDARKQTDLYRGKTYSYGFFQRRALAPLPRDITHSTWLKDFAAVKQQFIDTKFLASCLLKRVVWMRYRIAWPTWQR